jgi:4-carboxymuconolactone decarboxylase
MNKLSAAICMAASIVSVQVVRAEDITCFAPLKADELSLSQKAWADMIAAPPLPALSKQR